MSNRASIDGVSPFVEKLWAVMHDPECLHAIKWSDAGDSIVILDERALQKDVLPRYWKMTSFESFKRMLHMYGFSKETPLKHGALAVISNEPHSHTVFFHPFFLRGNAELLPEVQTNRRTRSVVPVGLNRPSQTAVLKKFRMKNGLANIESGLKQPTSSSSSALEVPVEEFQALKLSHSDLQERHFELLAKIEGMSREMRALWGEMAKSQLAVRKHERTLVTLVRMILTLVGHPGIGSGGVRNGNGSGDGRMFNAFAAISDRANNSISKNKGNSRVQTASASESGDTESNRGRSIGRGGPVIRDVTEAYKNGKLVLGDGPESPTMAGGSSGQLASHPRKRRKVSASEDDERKSCYTPPIPLGYTSISSSNESAQRVAPVPGSVAGPHDYNVSIFSPAGSVGSAGSPAPPAPSSSPPPLVFTVRPPPSASSTSFVPSTKGMMNAPAPSAVQMPCPPSQIEDQSQSLPAYVTYRIVPVTTSSESGIPTTVHHLVPIEQESMKGDQPEDAIFEQDSLEDAMAAAGIPVVSNSSAESEGPMFGFSTNPISPPLVLTSSMPTAHHPYEELTTKTGALTPYPLASSGNRFNYRPTYSSAPTGSPLGAVTTVSKSNLATLTQPTASGYSGDGSHESNASYSASCNSDNPAQPASPLPPSADLAASTGMSLSDLLGDGYTLDLDQLLGLLPSSLSTFSDSDNQVLPSRQPPPPPSPAQSLNTPPPPSVIQNGITSSSLVPLRPVSPSTAFLHSLVEDDPADTEELLRTLDAILGTGATDDVDAINSSTKGRHQTAGKAKMRPGRVVATKGRKGFGKK